MAEYRWLKNYDAEVPHSLEPYPQKTLIDYVDEAAKERPDAVVSISSKEIINAHTDFNLDLFSVFDGETELAFQIEKNKTKGAQILVLLNMKPNETKELKFTLGKKPSAFAERTYAEIAMKKNLHLCFSPLLFPLPC